eukprot:GHVQ01019779.1.p1 GENE.GHVQ01019779.1~~GHVQ01019779.1.p1  ORF type:complete len:146 (+),score=19.05 GHVQ01019779.1:2-439(+)
MYIYIYTCIRKVPLLAHIHKQQNKPSASLHLTLRMALLPYHCAHATRLLAILDRSLRVSVCLLTSLRVIIILLTRMDFATMPCQQSSAVSNITHTNCIPEGMQKAEQGPGVVAPVQGQARGREGCVSSPPSEEDVRTPSTQYWTV